MKKYTAIALTLFSLSIFAQELSLTSSEISDNTPLSQQQVFKGFGCDGGNISPALAWSGVPKGTKSFAITAYDPDAPTDSGWWHWSLVNIPVNINSLPADAGNIDGSKLPDGAIHARNDFSYNGFGGACPPEGDKPHHYHFKVWALKVEKLPIDNESSAALAGFMLNANKLATAELIPVYGR